MTDLFKHSVVNFLTTTRCNAWDLQAIPESPGVCRFCYREREQIHTTEEGLQAVVELAVKKLGVDQFTITGGEPTMSAWTPLAARFAKERGCRVRLHTNGLGFQQMYPQLKDYVDVFVLAIDGHSPEYADWERGIGYFDLFTKNIENLISDSKKIGFNSFISPHNFPVLDQLAEMIHSYADRIRVDYWLVSQYRDINRGSLKKKNLYLFSREDFIAKLRFLEDKYRRFIVFLQPADFIAAKHRLEQSEDRIILFGQPSRDANDEYPFRLWLGADGSISVDTGEHDGRNKQVGNLLDDDFEVLTNRIRLVGSRKTEMHASVPITIIRRT
jgi:MoaA/NifB/PqqE/SkfB family radical SAM enzyme